MIQQKQLYNYDDIDNMILEAKENKKQFRSLIEKQATGTDKRILLKVLSNFFVAEMFTKYDSDVCEQFIIIYETFRGWR